MSIEMKQMEKKCKQNDLQVDVLLVATEILESLYTHPSMIYIQQKNLFGGNTPFASRSTDKDAAAAELEDGPKPASNNTPNEQ